MTCFSFSRRAGWRRASFVFALSALALGSSASAQGSERGDRLLNANDFFSPDIYWVGDSGKLKIYPPKQAGSIEKNLPQLIAGDYAFVGAGDPSNLVVCGRDSASDEGFAQLFVWDTATSDYVTPIPGGVYRESGSDFVGVDWDESGLIYLLDAKKARIIFGPSPGAASLPSSWVTAVSSSAVPQLADASDRILSVLSKSNGDIELVLPRYRAEGANLVINLSQNGVTVIDPKYDSNRAYLNGPSIVANQESVAIKGPASTLVTLLDVTDLENVIELANGVTDTSGNAHVAVAPPGLQLGHVYVARSAALGTFDGPYKSPAILTGQAEELVPGTVMRPLDWRDALRSFVGNSQFSISVHLDPTGSAHKVTIPAEYDAFLNVGSSVDIVTLPDGQPFLASDVSLTTKARIWDEQRAGFGVVKLPFPDDSDLTGGVVYYQWIVLVNGCPYLSNIAGYLIRPGRWVPPGTELLFGEGPGDTSSGGGAQASSTSGGDTFDNAMRAWLNSSPNNHAPESLRRRVYGQVRRRR